MPSAPPVSPPSAAWLEQRSGARCGTAPNASIELLEASRPLLTAYVAARFAKALNFVVELGKQVREAGEAHDGDMTL